MDSSGYILTLSKSKGSSESESFEMTNAPEAAPEAPSIGA